MANVITYQLEDVAKMLHVIFVQLKAHQNMSDEMRRELEERKSKRQVRKAILTLIDNKK